MRTILMALVLGLCCTNFAFAQPEVIKYDVDPPAPVVLESVVQEATPILDVTSAPAVVVEQAVATPVCVGNACRVQQKTRSKIVHTTVERVQQINGDMPQRTQCRVQKVRTRIFFLRR